MSLRDEIAILADRAVAASRALALLNTRKKNAILKAMADEGTAFVNPPVPGGELPTSRSMIFVAPDGERSMNTYLGISSELGPEDVSDDVAGDTEVLFLEGYLYDKPGGMQAFERAARLTRANP